MWDAGATRATFARRVFRPLAKTRAHDVLGSALEAAAAQHRLLCAGRGPGFHEMALPGVDGMPTAISWESQPMKTPVHPAAGSEVAMLVGDTTA
jgi:hypothetical protein